MPPLPEPAFRLLWKHGDYHVTKAGIDDTDVFTAVEMHAYAAPLIARVAELQADATYPDDVEIAVPAIGSRWGHSNGDTYTVTGYADMFSDNHQRRPPRIVYRSAKTGRVWSREHSDWYRAMKPLDAAIAARKEQQP